MFPNVLMTKEAVDRELGFVVNVTNDGYLGEGPTENIAYLTTDNDLVFSSFDHTLKGTTLLRLQELSSSLIERGLIRKMVEQKQKAVVLKDAKEVFLIGTTLDAVSVIEVDGEKIGDGRPGAVAKEACILLRKDQLNNGIPL